MTWRVVTANQMGLIDGSGAIVRLVVERDPYVNEPDGKKYVVTGPGHTVSVHPTLVDAQRAAEDSLA